MRKYGISIEQYDVMLAAQGGACAICKRLPGDISLHVDHDHSSGAVRGLLCFPCNNALADFREDRLLLSEAAAYLDSHTASTKDEIALARERALSLARR